MSKFKIPLTPSDAHGCWVRCLSRELYDLYSVVGVLRFLRQKRFSVALFTTPYNFDVRSHCIQRLAIF